MSKENGFVPIRRGILEHIQDGRLTPLEFTAHYLITSQADTRTGKWIGSAKCLASALCITERMARKVLENLSRGGYIRRFAIPGKHVCYPILVHKFHPTNGEHKGEQLDAISSLSPTDLRYSQIDSGELVGEQRCEHRASQKRSEKGELKKKKEAAHLPLAAFWQGVGIDPERLPGKVRKLCADMYAKKGDQSAVDFLSACMDAIQGMGWNIPRQIAQAAAELRSNGNGHHQREPMPELEAAPWGAGIGGKQ